MNEYLTTSEAAEYLGVTTARVRQYIKEELLESEKYGRDHLIKRKDVEDLFKDGRPKRGRPPKL